MGPEQMQTISQVAILICTIIAAIVGYGYSHYGKIIIIKVLEKPLPLSNQVIFSRPKIVPKTPNIAPIIQKRITTVNSAQPLCSKW